jgi:hypothetical protein
MLKTEVLYYKVVICLDDHGISFFAWGGGVHAILKFYRAHEENLNHNSIAKVNHRKTSSSLKKKKKKKISGTLGKTSCHIHDMESQKAKSHHACCVPFSQITR